MTRDIPLASEQARQQAECWNGEMGETWVRQRAFIDQMLSPLADLLVDEVLALSAQHVLDVGCGNGTTTFAIGQALGEPSCCTGIDLSAPMITNAQTLGAAATSSPTFICADAAQHQFEPGSFDVLCSRFGVMFFANPVAAFRNLHEAAQPGGAMRLVVWREPAEGDFMTIGQRLVRAYCPDTPQRDLNAPGPFSFGSEHRATDILKASGWKQIAFQALDIECAFPVSDLDMFLLNLAPVGLDPSSLSSEQVADLRRQIRQAYEVFVDGEMVRFDAPIWLIGGVA